MLRRRVVLGLLLLVVVIALLPAGVRRVLHGLESTPVLRGRLLAAQVGCLACHSQAQRPEIPNPGSRWGTVPRFGSGNALMYQPTRLGIEEFIRFGAPRKWLDDEAIGLRLATQRLRMPAYGERLDDQQIADLVAYVAVVERVDQAASEAAEAGRELARQHGCFDCHGFDGAGGVANPGSLGGFVPGFAGGNFDHLVRDQEEFCDWVRTGTSSRLQRNPVARFFWRRQVISMPAYGADLSEEELDQLWAWVQAVRAAAAD